MTRRTAALCVCLLLAAGCASTSRTPTASWVPLDTGTDVSLRGVCAVGDGVVWASGADGTVLRSVDGGASWTARPVPAASGGGPNDIRDVEALDADRAWALSITEPARILRTVDGGVTWDVVHVGGDGAFLDSIALFEGGGAVAFGDPLDGAFDVVRSDDGVAWRRVAADALPAPVDGEAGFAASGTCVVAHGARRAWIGTGGAAARVLVSRDAGATWRAVDVPVTAGEDTTGIYSVAFRDERRGVVVGGRYDEPQGGGAAAWTTDGGQTWQPARLAPAGYRSGAAWLPTCSGWLVAVGSDGCSLSVDSGRTWHTMRGAGGYHAVSASGDGDVIAVGADGRAARLVR